MKQHQQRAIAAPFQQPKPTSNPSLASSSVGEGEQANAHSNSGTYVEQQPQQQQPIEELNTPPKPIDFRSFSFPPLQQYHELTTKVYCGPTTESNWVIPGVLLVGAYPATQDDDETWDLISSILKLGIKKFVCLQQEYRHGVPEDMWRSGLALRPYYEDVKHMVEHKEHFPHFRGHQIVDKDQLSFVHCPIVDCDVTDDHTVLNLCKQLVEDISKGEVIYLHCWGGHGRTGTVVSIMLHMMYGLSALEAMRRCQAVHDLRKCPVDVGSPQTQTQRDQVCRIVHHLIQTYKAEQRALEINQLKNPGEAAENTAPRNHDITTESNGKTTKQGSIQRTTKVRSSFNTIYDHQHTSTTTTTTTTNGASAAGAAPSVKLPKFPNGPTVQDIHAPSPTNSVGKSPKSSMTRSSFHAVPSSSSNKTSPLASIVKEKAPNAPQPMLSSKGKPSSGDGKPAASHAYKGHGHPSKPSSAEHKPIRGSVLLNIQTSTQEKNHHHHQGNTSILIPVNPHNSFAIGSQDQADLGSVSMDIVEDGDILRMSEHEVSDEMKARPMSICLDVEAEVIQQAEYAVSPSPAKDLGKDDVIRPTSGTSPTATRKTQENTVRNALNVARQVLLGKSPSAETNKAFSAGDNIPLERNSSKKKITPTPPSHAPPNSKSGVAANRKLEKEMTSIV